MNESPPDEPNAEERIEAGDPRYDGFRVTEVWAFVSVDPDDNQEGVCGAMTRSGVMMPLVASDRRRLPDMREAAEAIGQASGRRIVLKHFALVEGDEEEITP